eukprot:Em0043g15a
MEYFITNDKRSSMLYELKEQGSKVATILHGTKVVVEAIKGCGEFSSACHLDAISRARHESRKGLDEIAKKKLDAILAILSPGRQRAIMRVVEGKTSSWLTTLPLQSCHFDLAPVQFKDGLALRYLRHLSNLPAKCNGCGANFTLQHALHCKKGGLVILRHNATALVILPVRCAWPQVIKEPIVNEATATSSDPGLRLDLGIRGVWQPQVEALFDVRVIDHLTAIEHLMPFLNPAHRRRRECTKRQLKTEEAPSPHLSFPWMDYFTKRLVTSLSTWPLLCLQSGTKPILSPAATSDHGSLLQGFEQ